MRISDTSIPLLRRPFSIYAAQDSTLEIFFQVAGIGTRQLSRKQQGDRLDILGPLGKGFSLDTEGTTPNAVLVGGGRGIAPLYFLSEALQKKGARVTLYYGGKTVGTLEGDSPSDASSWHGIS